MPTSNYPFRKCLLRIHSVPGAVLNTRPLQSQILPNKGVEWKIADSTLLKTEFAVFWALF